MDSMQGLSLPEVERWSERVVVVRGLNPGPFTGPGTNTYLVGSGGAPLLLDTGAGIDGYIPLLEGALEQLVHAERPQEIVLTHVHPDHIGGARDVLDRFGKLRVSKVPWPERDAAFDLELNAVGDGAEFATEGATLRAIHTPGHAQDHLCYYFLEEKALFTGDLILGAGTTVIPSDGGDMQHYLDSLRRLLDLDLERIYPAHGPLIAEPHAKIREYLEHRLEREQQVIQALREGLAVVEKIVEKIYVDTPRALYDAAGQSVRSHLIKLERDGLVTRQSGADGAERWAAQ